MLRRFFADRSGVSSIEYALLVAFISAGIAGSLANIRDGVTRALNRVDLQQYNTTSP
jgi:Flp pilus assembly pilin Flp